jgi:hypothetical protein
MSSLLYNIPETGKEPVESVGHQLEALADGSGSRPRNGSFPRPLGEFPSPQSALEQVTGFVEPRDSSGEVARRGCPEEIPEEKQHSEDQENEQEEAASLTRNDGNTRQAKEFGHDGYDQEEQR